VKVPPETLTRLRAAAASSFAWRATSGGKRQWRPDPHLVDALASAERAWTEEFPGITGVLGWEREDRADGRQP
jgi:hypothetical protein